MKKIAGYLILTCVFGGIFSIAAMDIGLLNSVYVFVGVFVTAGLLWKAVNLIVEG